MKFLDKEINDYELINVINEGNYEQLDLLLEKYKPLMIKYAKTYEFDDMEDMLQEARMSLLKAFRTFTPEYNKSFTRYYELILKRRFQRLAFSKKTYIIYDTEKFDAMASVKCSEYPYSISDIPFEVLTDFEQEIIRSFIKEKKISDELKVTYGERSVHNALYRARKKLMKKLT